ncbi:MAG: hypothetical protein LUF89_02630 [Ruminococcus sp.]|nr:hypothetical protein [Ruminococcus sp.]
MQTKDTFLSFYLLSKEERTKIIKTFQLNLWEKLNFADTLQKNPAMQKKMEQLLISQLNELWRKSHTSLPELLKKLEHMCDNQR